MTASSQLRSLIRYWRICPSAPPLNSLIARLPPGVCPAGENGEFHTVVLQVPGMAQPLRVADQPQRRVQLQPPWRPTTLLFQPLTLVEAA